MTNLQAIIGLQVITLNPGIAVLERVNCRDIKTMGVSIAKEDRDVLTNPDWREGPIYRDNPNEQGILPGEVPCGETIEFRIIDLNRATAGVEGGTELVDLNIEVEISE
ncbi:MAG: hypothetical protein GXY44_00120 [Phycisphaerales bacterium]|nr:hypothetical protein [Phycisphaerales bacterium]